MATKKKAPKVKKDEVSSMNDYDDRSRISFKESQLPAKMSLEVGKNNTLTLEVQLVSERIEEYGTEKGKKSYTFAVNKLSKSE